MPAHSAAMMNGDEDKKEELQLLDHPLPTNKNPITCDNNASSNYNTSNNNSNHSRNNMEKVTQSNKPSRRATNKKETTYVPPSLVLYLVISSYPAHFIKLASLSSPFIINHNPTLVPHFLSFSLFPYLGVPVS